MHKQEKISIRQYSVGICAALVGIALFGYHALASETSNSELTSRSVSKDENALTEDATINAMIQSSQFNSNNSNGYSNGSIQNRSNDILKDTTTTSVTEQVENQSNLVINGDFSQSKTPSLTSKWGNDEAIGWESPWVDSKVKATDGEVRVVNGELLIGSKNETNRYRAATSQRVVVDSKKTYILEYDIRTENVKGTGARVRLYSQDAQNKNLPNQYEYTESLNGTATKHVKKVLMVSSETKKVKIELFLENGTGKAYFDNVTFKEYTPNTNNATPEVEKGEVVITSNKHYLVKRSNLNYVVQDERIATVKKGILLPKTVGQTVVHVYDNKTKVGEFTFTVQRHAETVYDELRNRWADVSLGNRMYNPKDDKMVAFLTKLEQGVKQSLDTWRDPSLNLPTIFSDIPFKASSDLTKAYRRLEQMAQVVENPHSMYYQNSDVLNIVKKGMKWLYDTHYNEASEITSITEKGNWWDYEIGTPRAVLNTLIYMYPYFTHDEMLNYTKPIRKFVPNTTMIRMTSKMGAVKAVGGNQTDISKVAILEGIVTENSQRIKDGAEALKTIMFFVTKGEGFYKDGSFIDHTNVAYTGSYGNVLIEGFSQLLPVIQNSPFALPADKVAIIDEWIDKAFMPIIVNGELMDMTRGRSISREKSESHVQAMEVLRSLVLLAQAATPERKQQLLSFVKGQIERDTYFDHYKAIKTYRDIDLLNQLLADNTIKGFTPKDYISAFNNMDKFVYHSHTHGFTFALSMYSKKTQNYEYMNKENRQGWYTADGMAYLYNGDLSHYSNNYWPTVYPYYMPGTTEVYEARSDKKPGMTTLKSDFVGATQLGQTKAAIGMYFNNWNNTLTAKKSWFVLGDKVVFLTTNIQNQSRHSAISTIENRKLTNTQYKYYINNQSVDLSNVVTTDKTKSFYMTNGKVNESIGYVFLNEVNTKAVVDNRQGSWHDVNEGQSKTFVNNSFATLWSEHTKQANHLAYVMVPNKSMADVQKSASSVEVIQQTNDIQAIYDKSLNVWGVVKYTDTPYTIDNTINLTSKGMYLVEKKANGNYHVAFYNPSQQTSHTQVTSVNDSYHVSILQDKTEEKQTTVWQVIKKNSNNPSDTPQKQPDTTPSYPNEKPNHPSHTKPNNKNEDKSINQQTQSSAKENGEQHKQHKQVTTQNKTTRTPHANTTENRAVNVAKNGTQNNKEVDNNTQQHSSETTNQVAQQTTSSSTKLGAKQTTSSSTQQTEQDNSMLYIVIVGIVVTLAGVWWLILGKKGNENNR